MRIYDLVCKLQDRYIDLAKRAQSTLIKMTQEEEFEMIMTRFILITH
jgi:hypothetical protein